MVQKNKKPSNLTTKQMENTLHACIIAVCHFILISANIHRCFQEASPPASERLQSHFAARLVPYHHPSLPRTLHYSRLNFTFLTADMKCSMTLGSAHSTMENAPQQCSISWWHYCLCSMSSSLLSMSVL